MSNLQRVFLLMFCVWAVGSNVCQLPTPKQKIDFSKMDPNWFVTFSTKDAFQTEDVKCTAISDITPMPDGFQFVVTAHYFFKDNPESWTIRKYEHADGNYAAHIPITSMVIDPKGNVNIKALFERGELNRGEVFHLTDYKNYFYHISCGLFGGYRIWGLTSTPDPGPDDIRNAINAIADYEFDMRIYNLSGCREIY